MDAAACRRVCHHDGFLHMTTGSLTIPIFFVTLLLMSRNRTPARSVVDRKWPFKSCRDTVGIA